MSHHFKPLTPLSFLDRAAVAFSEDTAVISMGNKLSFKELRDRALAVAEICRKFEVERLDNVVLLSDNCSDGVVCHFGIPASGGVIVSLNPYLDDRLLLKQLDASLAKVVFVNIEIAKNRINLISKMELKAKIVLINGTPFNDESKIDIDSFIDNLDFEILENKRLDDGVSNELDPIVMNFTSGTTGEPKGVLFSHRAAYLHSHGQIVMFELNRRSRYFWTLPMFHVNGWGHMWSNVAAGALQVVDPYHDLSEKEGIEMILEDYSINRIAGSPRLLSQIKFEALSGVIRRSLWMMTGGAVPPSSLIERAESMGVTIIHQYGLNETCGPILVSERRNDFTHLPIVHKSKLLRRQGVEGVHASGSLKVLSIDDESEVPKDGVSIGEIVLKGNTIALGYFGNREATEASFREKGFFTGDLAVVHPNGDVELVDRKKDLIHVDTPYGWENVPSIEIERVLLDTGLIDDCAVIGFESIDGKRSIAACVECSNFVDGNELIETCKNFLPFYKVPSIVIFVQLPKTKTGKVQKGELRILVDEILQTSDMHKSSPRREAV